MKTFITAALLTLATPVFAEAPGIDGQWISAAPENLGQMHATRDFTFQGDAWSISFKAFSDAELVAPLFTLEVAGHFRVGGASQAVPGAWNAVFGAFDKTVTAHSTAAVDMFGSMGCTLVIDQPFDLTDQACGFFHATMDTLGEYDLIALMDDQLFLGDRSGDLTKARPTALTPFPLIKK